MLNKLEKIVLRYTKQLIVRKVKIIIVHTCFNVVYFLFFFSMEWFNRI